MQVSFGSQFLFSLSFLQAYNSGFDSYCLNEGILMALTHIYVCVFFLRFFKKIWLIILYCFDIIHEKNVVEGPISLGESVENMVVPQPVCPSTIICSVFMLGHLFSLSRAVHRLLARLRQNLNTKIIP
ncbi:hypothetical protein J1N35_032518 [Gossypium stocksii]|uniref:Uncharacterized protein n=1 Tax=Gossypium stocksii TaxID=47602 RepID=A0A9D3V3J0_9ROSI|nr:hypothetical protein J1N35_032518 [Gossypium stocksii]